MSDEELKGTLEVTVTYMDSGLMKTRTKNVKQAEMPYVLKDMMETMLRGLAELRNGEIPKNVFPVYSDKQLREI